MSCLNGSFILGYISNYCIERCPGQCKCKDGYGHNLGHQLNKYTYCDYHCSAAKYPEFGKCGNTGVHKQGQDCEECKGRKRRNIYLH